MAALLALYLFHVGEKGFLPPTIVYIGSPGPMAQTLVLLSNTHCSVRAVAFTSLCREKETRSFLLFIPPPVSQVPVRLLCPKLCPLFPLSVFESFKSQSWLPSSLWLTTNELGGRKRSWETFLTKNGSVQQWENILAQAADRLTQIDWHTHTLREMKWKFYCCTSNIRAAAVE